MKRDPLEQLRLDVEPLMPRPEFAEELESRLRHALGVLLVPMSSGGDSTMANRVIEPAITAGVSYVNMRRAIRWLTEILGLRVARMWGPEDSPLFAYLSWRTDILSVSVRAPKDNAWSQTGPASIGLLADEETIKQAYDRALAAGADVVKPLAVDRNPAVPEGYLGFALRDAEGNLWSMYSRGPRFELHDDRGAPT